MATIPPPSPPPPPPAPPPYGALRFVDKVGNNFLFRGPKPIDGAVYDTNFPTILKNYYPALPAQFYLVVLCLLYANTDDGPFVAAELDYFLKNPDQGQIHLWDTYGSVPCYFNCSRAEREERMRTFDAWLGEPLVWRTATLRYWLETSQLPYDPPSGIPYVFYVHCSGGCDRTGEMIGAYRLRYMNSSWLDMWNEQPCGRPLGCNNYRALQWYAYWLNATHGFNLTRMGEVDGGCYDGPTVGTHKPCSPLLT